MMNAPLGPTEKMQRTFGEGRLTLKSVRDRTRLQALYQEGSAKIRLPKTYGSSQEAVIINTAGGLTGGDRMLWSIEAQPGARGVITTQASEKIYKSSGGVAQVENRIQLNRDAALDWLPQETILFERSGLHRTLHVDMHPTARFMALEAIMLGRAAMDEVVCATDFKERWRIHRDGRLLHADDLRLAGDIPALRIAPASLNGNAAFASFVYCGPEDEDTLHTVAAHAIDAQNLSIGMSVMENRIVARFLGKDAYHLRHIIVPFLAHIRERLGVEPALPKVWNL